MIRRAVWYAVAGLITCMALSVSVTWALVITVGTAVIGAI